MAGPMTDTRMWYCVDILRNGQWVYLGKVYETERDVRTAFPYASIAGTRVRLWSIFHD